MGKTLLKRGGIFGVIKGDRDDGIKEKSGFGYGGRLFFTAGERSGCEEEQKNQHG